MSNSINREYLGQRLLERGFEVWFRYLFRVIEGTPFTVDPIHPDLFKCCQDIYDLKTIRLCLNLPPRSAKTTLMSYLVVFAITNNPKCNIIYTSYSQALLGEISTRVMNILESPIYKAMYPNKAILQSEIANPVDDFWNEYRLKETEGKSNIYNTKRIQTYAGGLCIFASIGSQITGYGCGIRNGKGFTGMLVIDDANKPADMRSQIMREKVLRYYEETLLSRLNNSNVPIVNVQQRLHVEDLSGLLLDKYKFKILRKPLLDENGICQIPTQYTKERIDELKVNNYMFETQYQQNAIVLGGQVIKRDYFRYYLTAKEYKYKRIIIAADTAMKTKEYNDYSVFIAGGITPENQLHVLDMIRGKWEAPELEKMAVMFWNKFKRNPVTGLTCNGLYIEDKASGIGLIQGLKAKYGIPVMGLKADTDKLTHVETMLPYMESGQVYLPENENYGFNPDLLSECEAFSRDMSHSHDDIVDALCYLIQEGIAQLTVSLLDYFRD